MSLKMKLHVHTSTDTPYSPLPVSPQTICSSPPITTLPSCLPFLLLPLLPPSAMQQLFIDSNDQWERVLWEPSSSRSPGHPAADQPARAFLTFLSKPRTTTGCAGATEPEHSVFWMESHQQEGRDALGAPLQQKSISQTAGVSL